MSRWESEIDQLPHPGSDRLTGVLGNFGRGHPGEPYVPSSDSHSLNAFVQLPSRSCGSLDIYHGKGVGRVALNDICSTPLFV